jgi:HJR/Mrr/RecB family endonuclease
MARRKQETGCLVGLIALALTPVVLLLKLMFSKNPFKTYWLPALCVIITAVVFRSFWWVWVPVFATMMIIVLVQNRRQKFVALTLAQIDALDGPQFERYLDAFFRARGCQVVHTGRSGDFGADLIVVDKGVKYAVQAKNYDTGNVNNKAVQEAFTAASYYGCSRAMVVTNSRFTEAAREQARKCKPPVLLMGRDELTHLLKRMA